MLSSGTAAAAGHFPVWAQICYCPAELKTFRVRLGRLETGGNRTHRAAAGFVKIRSWGGERTPGEALSERSQMGEKAEMGQTLGRKEAKGNESRQGADRQRPMQMARRGPGGARDPREPPEPRDPAWLRPRAGEAEPGRARTELPPMARRSPRASPPNGPEAAERSPRARPGPAPAPPPTCPRSGWPAASCG